MTVAAEPSRVERLKDWFKRNTETVDPHKSAREVGGGGGGDDGPSSDHGGK